MMSESFIKAESKVLLDSLQQIEFFDVLEIVRKYAYSDLGYKEIRSSMPVNDLNWLRTEHNLIEEMWNVIMLDDALPLEGIKDVKASLHKTYVENAVLNTDELLNVKDFIRASRLIKRYFEARSSKYPKMNEECTNLIENIIIEKHINEAIDDTGEIRDTASKELLKIRHDINSKSNRLRSRVQKLLKRTIEEDKAQEDFYTIREGRFVLPLKAEYKRQIPGIIHGISQTGSTVFIEPSEIFEMNNELALLVNEEKREIYRIISNLTKEIGNLAESFLNNTNIISHIDSIYAKAKYALEYGGEKPDISDENIIELHHIKHPLLAYSKGKEKVISLNIEFDDIKRGHLISGPNAGGKTVALKSIGLNIALALSGIFPLGRCKTNFRRIFSSIGDHQSIENDLSTFSSQIFQLKEIIDYCDDTSLVLIDEIGSGTDPQEGAALAAGILDSFINVKLFFVATTHQSSLKTYALNREMIENASLEFDNKKLMPTYNFMSGIPGNSYAFDLAKNLGIPKNILDRAHSYLGSRQKELEESIQVLQEFRSKAQEKFIESEQLVQKTEKIKADYEQKLKKINDKRKEMVKEAYAKAEEILKGANALIENTIREVKENKKAIGVIKKDFEQQKEDIKQKIVQTTPKETQRFDTKVFAVGDTVAIEESSNVGVILEIDKKSNSALVEANGFKFRFALSKLSHSKVSQEQKQKYTHSEYIKYDSNSRIDVRGERAAEAITKIDDFIASANVSGLTLLTIVHGKGTGALRIAIHEYLENHHLQLKYRLGELVEGGAGVTIIEM